MPSAIYDTGNGIVLKADDVRYRLDPPRPVANDRNVVSHAHSDHAPLRFRDVPILCSDATYDLLRLRRKGLRRTSCDNVELLDAGHIPGSRMIALECCDIRMLYTGDFCTRRKNHLSPARPAPCDVLVTETTYGKEGYEFPDHEETVGAISDWVDSNLASDRSVVLLAYPLGKAQELAYELGGRPVRVQRGIGDNHRVLRAHGFTLPTEGLGNALPTQPVVYITSGLGRESARVDRLVKDGAKTASFSGWSANGSGWRPAHRTDEEFPLSDHCDYNELMEFVRLCGPERVLATHGFAREFSESVKNELGIDAGPLQRGQSVLGSFV
ncbi:MAG: mRNA 3'-end processing factor [Methanobacteriota archaeon]|nr:MAG: mRNA 3'-end processing factor [Euryarchaeota archaeon]